MIPKDEENKLRKALSPFIYINMYIYIHIYQYIYIHIYIPVNYIVVHRNN
jgi:hypothetical protein